jgi:DHA3 family macrolide efflux protein-like MFS transporter
MLTRAVQNLRASPVLVLLRNRPFALLWLAQIVSSLGDWALYIVVPVTVYKATGSKSALGIAIVCSTLPALLFSLLGGVLADRWSQRRTMIAADLARMAAILMLLHVSNTRHFGPHDLSLFYIVSFLVASFSCFFGPARQRLMRVLVPQEQLVQANSLVFIGAQTTWLLGPAIGGLLLAYFSAKSVFVFDAATFAVSALLISGIRGGHPNLSAKTKTPCGPAGVWEDAREGIAYVSASPILRPALTLLLIGVMATQITNTLEFPFIRDVWGGTSREYAGLVSLGFSAALLTGLAASGTLRTFPPARLLLVGFTVMGLTGLVFSQSAGIVLGGAMLFLAGVGGTIQNIGNMTLFQSGVPPQLQGRVSATISLCMKLAMVAGGLLTVGLSDFFPGSMALRSIFAAVALVYLFCGLLAWRTLGRFTVQDVLDAGSPPVAEPEEYAEPSCV